LQTGPTIITKTLWNIKGLALWIKILKFKDSFICSVKVLCLSGLMPQDLWSEKFICIVFLLFYVFPDKFNLKS